MAKHVIDLSDMKPSDAQALYDHWTSQLAVATHRARLRSMRSFFTWAIERGYMEKNPFASVKAIGKAHRGKPQPRVDEAQKLYAELCRLAWAGESPAACLLVQILAGPRSSEVLGLRVRDVDGNGSLLHLAAQGGKTSNAPRILEIDLPSLRDLLRSAWMFAVGVMDAYLCDAYCFVLASTLRAKSLESAVALPSFIWRIEIPIGAILKPYSKRPNWRWRMAARAKMEKDNVLVLETVRNFSNPFMEENNGKKLFLEVLPAWISRKKASARLFGIAPAA